jgi:UDP-N-acetylmuramyl pentapeptide phosphotransferase/UDP-N-acetylglucosamine-1-phosphate transferase
MSHSELLVGSQYFAVNWLQIAFLLIPAAAVLGFLPWNFPRALTFMGDSGSLPLGGILALMAAWGGRDSLDSLLAHLFPLSLFIYDVLFTVVRRARRGENLMAAHRGHLYQRMLIATHWSHARLLAFHLPYYLATGALGLGYHIAFGPNARFALPPFVGRLGFFLALAVLLNWYTTKVWRAEKHVAAPSRETQT